MFAFILRKKSKSRHDEPKFQDQSNRETNQISVNDESNNGETNQFSVHGESNNRERSRHEDEKIAAIKLSISSTFYEKLFLNETNLGSFSLIKIIAS